MVQSSERSLSNGEVSAIASRDYWKNVAETDADPTIRKNAAGYVKMYENEILMLEGIDKRYKMREIIRNTRVPPPPLTLFEMACAPLYVAQVCFEILFIGGMWTVGLFVLIGSIIGLGFMK